MVIASHSKNPKIHFTALVHIIKFLHAFFYFCDFFLKNSTSKDRITGLKAYCGHWHLSRRSDRKYYAPLLVHYSVTVDGCRTCQPSIGLCSVLRPRQHSIGYTGDGFYRSKDPTNSIKVLKEMLQRKKQRTKTTKSHI